MITKYAYLLGALVLCVGSQALAGPVFIYQNLVTEGTYQPYSPGAWGFGITGADTAGLPPFLESHSQSASFVATSTAQLSAVFVAISNVYGSSAFNLSLTDSSGDVLEFWTGLLPPAPLGAGLDPVVDVASVLHPLLTSGHEYTLTASAGDPTTYDGWNIYPAALNGTPTVNGVEGSGTVGFDVVGSSATVPEPRSVVIALIGITGVGLSIACNRKSA
jgi:hypothetical protein